MSRRAAAALASVLLAALALAGPVSADPSHNAQEPFTQTCSNGQTIEVMPGTLKNQSSIAFVTTSNQIAVAKSLLVEVEGVPVYSFERGLKGFNEGDLITCVGEAEPGVVVTARLFLTPRRP